MSRTLAVKMFGASGLAAFGTGLGSCIASERVVALRWLGDSIDGARLLDAVRISDRWLMAFLVLAALTVLSYAQYVAAKRREVAAGSGVPRGFHK
jgi:hypothetical protein